MKKNYTFPQVEITKFQLESNIAADFLSVTENNAPVDSPENQD